MPNKRLGQHWLKDRLILEAIADSVPLSETDTVLEIGPGLGTLTSVLLRRAGRVVAVEYDAELARKLPAQFPGTKLEVTHADILGFDLSGLPVGYRVVANVPYYITQKIVENFLFAVNKPESMTLLVQQEVAEKLAANRGNTTAIAMKLQYQYNVHLGTRVPKEYFTPPPMVDSQVVLCKKRHMDNNADINVQRLYRVIDAGFSAPRKKLRTSLAGGLGMQKDKVELLCRTAGIDLNMRPSEISLEQWKALASSL